MKQKIKFICLYLFIPMLVIYACTSGNSNVNGKKIAEGKNNEKFVTKENEKVAQFVVDNVSTMSDEIRLAEIAEKHASDEKVRKVAKDVRIHYGKLVGQLKEYAVSKAISFPATESFAEKNKIEKLANDKTFEKDWSTELRDLNKETIENFENGSNSLSDENLKIWARACLPEIRRSHDKIIACNNNLK